MTVQECYELFGGNYDEVLSRLRADDRIIRFLKMALGDGSYQLLIDSIDTNNVDEAFRAAHTLKGVCGNLSITRLGESSTALCEYLRENRVIDDKVMSMLPKVKEDYELTINAIKQLVQQ